MTAVVAKLEITLGPGTADLRLRVGLHSGLSKKTVINVDVIGMSLRSNSNSAFFFPLISHRKGPVTGKKMCCLVCTIIGHVI